MVLLMDIVTIIEVWIIVGDAVVHLDYFCIFVFIYACFIFNYRHAVSFIYLIKCDVFCISGSDVWIVVYIYVNVSEIY